ncbi:MFS transporter [Kutzneria sp. NPDC052558]|uniref:MFS transporter n=1 Tax=Kutzneria sp. NPDC052558 TaxID=3364121 RepID=UPI0037C904BC
MRTPLLALLTGSVVSSAGTSMTVLAIPWFVLHTTGSAAQTGLVAAAEVAGLAVATGLGGPIADRIQPRLVSIASDTLAAVAVGLVPALTMLNLLPLWGLVLLTALLGLTRGPGSTAADMLLPSAAKLAGTPITRAASWFEGAFRIGRLVGGVSAGALIAFLGPAQVLYVDSVSYLVSALLTAVFIHVRLHQDEPKAWTVGGHLAELREGFRYLMRDRLLAAVVGMVLVTNMLDGAYVSVLLPSYGTLILHSSVLLGVVASVSSAATLCGVMAYGAVGERLPKWGTYAVAFLIAGTPKLVLMALEPSMLVLLPGLAVSAFAFGMINPILLGQLYSRVPETLRGRVFGVVASGALAGIPVGALLAGVLVQFAGLRSALLGAAALYFVMTLCPFVFRVWRRLDEPVEEASGDHVGGAIA